jgi:hypothetical protein
MGNSTRETNKKKGKRSFLSDYSEKELLEQLQKVSFPQLTNFFKLDELFVNSGNSDSRKNKNES